MKKTLALVLFFILLSSSVFIFFAKFPHQKKPVLAQTCQDDDGICPEGCTPENDNDCTIEGDLNKDGQVNSQDLKILIENWGDPSSLPQADLNTDGVVNGVDFTELARIVTKGTSHIAPEEILHFNPEYNSGWVYIAQTAPENGKAFWVAVIRSLSKNPTDTTAQLLYGITDADTGEHYSGFLDRGSFSEDPNGVNLSFRKGEKEIVKLRQTKADLSEFELAVNLPWNGGHYQVTKTLSFNRPILYESGDGIIPMGGGIDSLYVSLVLDQGFWVDFQKFNIGSEMLIPPRYGLPVPNHRWMSFILDEAVGPLPTGTVGVGWEILDANNRRQPGEYTNVDVLVPGYPQITATEEQINSVEIDEIEYWNSGHRTYLKRWKIAYPGIDLLFETLIPNQESDIGGFFHFYEGAIKVIDPQTGMQVGTGMLEQTHDEREIVIPEEIRHVLDQIKEGDPILASLMTTFLLQHPEYIEEIQKIITVYETSQYQVSSASEHGHSISLPTTSPEQNLSCEVYTVYPEETRNVFERRMNEDWDESGNWRNDWETVNDATAFGPSILYPCAFTTGSEELERRANKTVEYEISLIDEILSGNFGEETIGKAAGGMYALLAGRERYSGTQENKRKIEIYSRAMAIAPALALIHKPELAEKSPAGEVIAVSGATDYNFSLAEITENALEKEIYVRLGKYLIENILEKYWKEDGYGGYYKSKFFHGGEPPEGPIAFDQGMPLSALAKAYSFGADDFYLDRATAIKTTLDINLWDKSRKGYYAATSGTDRYVKFLSGNSLITRGYLDWFRSITDYGKPEDGAKRKEFRDYAGEIADFILQDLYSSTGGFFAHDTYGKNWYCTGCNFLTLYNFHQLARCLDLD